MSINEFMHKDITVLTDSVYGNGHRGILVRATKDHLYLENACRVNVLFLTQEKTELRPLGSSGKLCVPRNQSICLTAEHFDVEPIDGEHLLDRELVKRRSRKRIEEIRKRNKPGFISTRIKKVKDAWVEMVVGVALTVAVMYVVAMSRFPLHG